GRHLPDLEEHALGGLKDWKIHISADIEDDGLKRRVRVGFVEESGDVVLFTRIEAARDAAAACAFDGADKLREFVGGASPRENSVALGGEFLGDGGADIVARADNGDRGVACSHGGVLLTPS